LDAQQVVVGARGTLLLTVNGHHSIRAVAEVVKVLLKGEKERREVRRVVQGGFEFELASRRSRPSMSFEMEKNMVLRN
jgi:hypothetical protein